MIAFNKYYNQFNILSISLVVVSLFLLTFKGLNFGIDFKGGTLIELRSNDSKINVIIGVARTKYSRWKIKHMRHIKAASWLSWRSKNNDSKIVGLSQNYMFYFMF